jgi:hypothetical protein
MGHHQSKRRAQTAHKVHVSAFLNYTYQTNRTCRHIKLEFDIIKSNEDVLSLVKCSLWHALYDLGAIIHAIYVYHTDIFDHTGMKEDLVQVLKDHLITSSPRTLRLGPE